MINLTDMVETIFTSWTQLQDCGLGRIPLAAWKSKWTCICVLPIWSIEGLTCPTGVFEPRPLPSRHRQFAVTIGVRACSIEAVIVSEVGKQDLVRSKRWHRYTRQSSKLVWRGSPKGKQKPNKKRMIPFCISCFFNLLRVIWVVEEFVCSPRAMAFPPSLAPEIGPDGIARESPVIAYTEKVNHAFSLFAFYLYLKKLMFDYCLCFRCFSRRRLSRRNSFKWKGMFPSISFVSEIWYLRLMLNLVLDVLFFQYTQSVIFDNWFRPPDSLLWICLDLLTKLSGVALLESCRVLVRPQCNLEFFVSRPGLDEFCWNRCLIVLLFGT